MKLPSLILLIPLLAVTPSCETVKSVLAVPAAVVSDVGGAVETTVGVVSPEPAAEAAGQVASTGATLLTGNAAIGAGVGAVVTALVGIFLRKKKATA